MATSAKPQRTETLEKLYNGRLRIERRNGSSNLYARTFLQGKWVVKTTGESTLTAARKIADRWFLHQKIRVEKGEPVHASVPFASAVQSFLKHADTAKKVTEGQIQNYRDKWTLLQPHFHRVSLTDITLEWLEALRSTRKASLEIVDALGRRRTRKRPVSNATLKKDFDFIRLVLRHAVERDKVLDRLPVFPEFEGRVWSVAKTPRPYLPLQVWNGVKKRALQRINEPAGKHPATAAKARGQRQELYAFMMLCVGAALRVDEAHSLRWKDCTLGAWKDGTEFVHLWVFGKHSRVTGVREEGWAMYDGVVGFKYLKKLRPNANPDDPLFFQNHRDGMKLLLEDCGVREDLVTGMTSDAKSLRQTGISMRLDLGPDPSYRDIAKWARTSQKQIADYYDQTHPEESVKRIAGFRSTGNAELDRLRAQAANESTMDNDDVYGADVDETWEEV